MYWADFHWLFWFEHGFCEGVSSGFSTVDGAVERAGDGIGLIVDGVGASRFDAGCGTAMGFNFFSRTNLYFSHSLSSLYKSSLLSSVHIVLRDLYIPLAVHLLVPRG